MTDTHTGKVIDGRYRLDRILGEGASGAVYAATQLSVDRTVAVKILHGDDSPRFAERFQAEARAIGKLNHTNIITLHDFGYDEELGAHYMVTEYAEGVPLSERMKEVMSTDLTLKVALEVASAMHHAHAQGILHRDLKPENVILTRADGRVDVAKVLDFGLVELFDPSESTEGVETVNSEAEVKPGGGAPSLMALSEGTDDPFKEGDDASTSDELEYHESDEAFVADDADEEPATAILPPVDLSDDARDEAVQAEIDAQFAADDESGATDDGEPGAKDE